MRPTPPTPIDFRGLAQIGIEALRRGDHARARQAFEEVVSIGGADASIFVALARACGGLNDLPAARSAVEQALALEPGHLAALILMGDHLAREGDARAAAAFYMAAVKSAPAAHELPAEARGEVARAQALCQKYALQFENVLRARLANRGSSARFAHSLDLLFGRRQIYFQQPRYYYFPELPQVQFYERDLFPWLAHLEAAVPEIRAELMEVLNDPAAFAPYVQGDARRPQADASGMLNNPAWSAYYLWKNGEIVSQAAAQCPGTMKALAQIPLATVKNRSPSALFSLLRPGARIPAHNGYVNTRLIGHLPLIVPPGCAFRVGNEVREWVEGRAWIFDDTIEHEAWNRSGKTRVILLFEIWRPELTSMERELVRSMFEAIDEEGTGKVAWEI